ncbi:MAG: radical SAM protein [Rhodospirillaceae bacterium]|nr:radical SAM protein [Rhodospirillaceae bacterium]
MTDIDVVMVTPPSRLAAYQGLSNNLAAIEPPVWSGLIAAYLQGKNFNVAMIDAEADGLNHADTAKAIAKINPRLAVFCIYGQQPSASTQCMPGGSQTCHHLNEISDIPSLVLGTHPSALPQRTMEEEPFKFVCQGEGPRTVESLLNALQDGGDLATVPGLWFRDENGVIVGNEPAAKIADLDGELPRQAWDLLDLTKYRAHNWHCFHDLDSRGSYASIQTSLGCPYRCEFCCINAPFGGRGVRNWSLDNVIAQIDELVTRYGIKNIKIPDEMFILNERHVLGICDRLIERDYGLNIWAYARIDTMRESMFEKLKAAGFNWLGLGIESASSSVRDGMAKGSFNDDMISDVVRTVRDHGIAVGANYIFGLPDDTMESMNDTLDLAMELNTEWANFYCAMAYPGSPLYQHAKAQNWRLPDDDDGPGWIGYSQLGYEALPLPTMALSARQVLEFRDHAFNRYFTNPSYLTMLEAKFGPEAVTHVKQMTSHQLKRRQLETPSRQAQEQAQHAESENRAKV